MDPLREFGRALLIWARSASCGGLCSSERAAVRLGRLPGDEHRGEAHHVVLPIALAWYPAIVFRHSGFSLIFGAESDAGSGCRS